MSGKPSDPQTIIESTDLLSALQNMFETDDVKSVAWSQHAPNGTVGTSGGTVSRLTGTATVGGTQHPWSLIRKKLASPQSRQATSSDELEKPSGINYWKREYAIYRSGLLDELPDSLAAPRCYRATETSEGCTVWLEEIREELPIWPLDRYGPAAQSLGAFNGHYLTQRPIPDYPWFTIDINRQREQKNRKSLARLDELRQQPIVRRGWPDDVTEGILRIAQERELFFQALDRLPRVLRHADAGRRNLLSRRGKEGQTETVAIDWGYAGIGAVGSEIAPTVVSSALWFQGVTPEQLPELEEIVFTGYLQGLRQAGWEGDARLARLGYLCTVALRFGIAIAIPEILALEQMNRASVKDVFGWSIEEWSDALVGIRRFVIQRAEAARQLIKEGGN
ncbi:MAG: phosphotransferase [Caldilineaceae bacterium]|nr:phosphotransferase [Caldilineaceae bacterium]HRJ40972.1 phosphotransferase [Caldilineaceae bacterium]